MPTTFFTVHLNDVRVVDLVPVDKVYVSFLFFFFFVLPLLVVGTFTGR